MKKRYNPKPKYLKLQKDDIRRINRRVRYKLNKKSERISTIKRNVNVSNIYKMDFNQLKRFARKRDKIFKNLHQKYADAKYQLLNKPPESPFKANTELMHKNIKWNKKSLQKAVIEREKNFNSYLDEREVSTEELLNDPDELNLLVLEHEFLKYAESGERDEWFNEAWFADKQNDLMNAITEQKQVLKNKRGR